MNIRDVIQAEIDKVQAKFTKGGLLPFPIPFKMVPKLRKDKFIAMAYSIGHIEFNMEYFQYPEDIPVAELVAHEVAHMYQYRYFPTARQAHGREFRMLMRFLGYKGNMSVSVTGQARAASVARSQAATAARKPKTKTRHVYLTIGSNREVLLTSGQHKKQQACLEVTGRGRYTSKGEHLVATGQVKKFK